MSCFECGREHAVMWTWRIRVGRMVVERVFCNRCELAKEKNAREALV